MGVMEVLVVGDGGLREVCSEVEVFDDGLLRLIADMRETMVANEGVGLAAPQVGILKRVIVVQFQGRKVVLVNPVILETSGEMVTEEEGCLSCPHKTILVERASKVKVKGKGKRGDDIVLEEEGFIGRIIQHEVDHLEGVLIVDKGEEVSHHREL